ncbi:hypothetical protein [Methanogenium cariaci]|uniref:hypothetical protein n=1 Tax=Methanogenium cariaci TaxID=2197 RepID=UPI0007825347|nr:hypothetical protein [Methanogenium cariaci]
MRDRCPSVLCNWCGRDDNCYPDGYSAGTFCLLSVLEPLDGGVILRCLEKRPNDRFASADDLREALETAGGNTFPPGA